MVNRFERSVLNVLDWVAVQTQQRQVSHFCQIVFPQGSNSIPLEAQFSRTIKTKIIPGEKLTNFHDALPNVRIDNLWSYCILVHCFDIPTNHQFNQSINH